jgi:hypothetical protein
LKLPVTKSGHNRRTTIYLHLHGRSSSFATIREGGTQAQAKLWHRPKDRVGRACARQEGGEEDAGRIWLQYIATALDVGLVFIFGRKR